MIKNIVFDFGGVLIEYSYAANMGKYGVPQEEIDFFLTHILTQENNDLEDLAEQPWSYYIDLWKHQWPDHAAVIDIFDRHYVDFYTGESEGIVELMQELKSRGYRLLGLSNWGPRVHEIMAKLPRPFSLLEGWVISYQVHQLKPHLEIFQTFCRKFGVRPEECLFIDDRADNILGAQSAGWQGVVFQNTEQLRCALPMFLNKNE